jgi:hypothetical protein
VEPGGGEENVGKISLGPFCHLSPSPAALFTKKKFNSHIVKIHRDPIS